MINCIKCGALHEGDTCPKCIDKELKELRAKVIEQADTIEQLRECCGE